MTVKKNYFSLIIFLILFLTGCQSKNDQPIVLMVSFDGFRHDYVEKYDAKNFKQFISKGVSAEALTPAYPSKTFPNHYTMVTGLYPGHHGLVDNYFYDRSRDTVYSMRDRNKVEDAYYYGGTPLWQLVQENGMKSASYFWVGSEAPIKGRFPDYYFRYDGSVTSETRINQVFEWIQLPEEQRPRFITLYFSFVDSEGHSHGPDSDEVRQAVLEADRLLALIMTQVAQQKVPVDVILVSDHGMRGLPSVRESFIFMEDVIQTDHPDYRVTENYTHLKVYCKDSVTTLSVASSIQASPDYKVYTRWNAPSHFILDHDRSGDIVIEAIPGKRFIQKDRYRNDENLDKFFGVHGWDPKSDPQMGGIFYASGPSFKTGETVGAIENVHLYPLICKILNIEPAPNDGDLSVMERLLTN